MSKFKLAFGIHNHQPVGNFTAVFDEAHRQAYLPFLKLLSEYERIPISLHQSGILWDWQKQAHPEYFELVGRLVDRGQLELMTGGFYEPILTAVPQRDAMSQIGKLSRYLRDHFDFYPQGLWLTERIWEPHLPKLLADADVKYLPIDDTHFIYAGFDHSQLTGPFVTEEEGRRVVLLPIQKRLRYLIPFGMVDELIEELRRQAERNPEGMAVYADDGEKFGVWPQTHRHCYHDGWLRRFFDALEANSDWLEVIPLGRAALEDPVGRAYLPSASYEEMLHWSLPTKAFMEYEAFEHWLADQGNKERWGRFVRGGHWRGFLTKYAESNLMHKKMLWTSDELLSAEQKYPARQAELQQAREHLYASQCNCPYWHGVFGGLYLPHIRQAVYGHMIEAHDTLRRLAGRTGLCIDVQDYDADGRDEILVDSDQYTAVFKPDQGGTLLDLALNQHHFALTDTMTRRREGYHQKLQQAKLSGEGEGHASIHDLVLVKEEGLAGHLMEDKYLKRCFIDHFLADGVTMHDFQSGHFAQMGDFVAGRYDDDVHEKTGIVVLRRDGLVTHGRHAHPVRIAKEFQFTDGAEEIAAVYHLSTTHPGGFDVVFAVENNFNFQAGHAEDRYVLIDGKRAPDAFLDSVGSHSAVTGIALVDDYRSLACALSCEQACDIWHMPIFTVSLSEGGFEKVYQGTTVVHSFRLHLSAEPARLRFVLMTGHVSSVLERAFGAAAPAALPDHSNVLPGKK
jgi:4-alpha-glucanotransferase